MGGNEILHELLAVERRGWDALCAGTGSDFYGELMTGDAVMVLANGMILDRAAVVASLRAAPPWRAYEIEDPRVVDLGADGKVLVYRAAAYRDGSEPAFRGVMSSTYIPVGSTWRLACYQQTRLPD
ncbi:nuclear transport factor 2 family protein [Nocardia sp. NPDC127579]|uniref:nuclear transport factor 2 family protein n=1 Tax=Nocardia sp. NPDC127579 TaxID=3345402 RepID=UPI00362D4F82